MTRRGIAGPAAAALLLLGLVPLAEVIPGGHEPRRYGEMAAGWWSGTLLCAGLGVIGALTFRRWPGHWPAGLWERWTTRWSLTAPRASVGLALVAAAAYAAVALAVFDGRPLFLDEITQVWQARRFADGILWLPSAGLPEFFGSPLLIDDGTRVFGQFPAAGPAMLTLGTLIGAEWLVGPAFGALAVWAMAGVLRTTREPMPIATGGLLLLAFAPFALFMSGSHMNHVPTLAWILVGLLGTSHLTEEGASAGWALVAGVGFGVAAAIRPVDGVAFAAPVGVWLLARAWADRQWMVATLCFGAAAALPVAGDLWVNLQTTGDPFLFGYRVLWGAAHDLGFHQAPWGAAHTPLRGLELISTYLVRLQAHFLETPFPALIPAMIALFWAPPLKTFDRLLLASGAVLLGLYAAYWHEGSYLGPRFAYPLLPLLALWTCRALSAVRRRFGDGMVTRAATVGWGTGLLVAALVGVPVRFHEYRNALTTARWPAREAAAQAGIRGSLIFVRESFGAQIVARLWALGLTRAEAEFLFRRVDACRLHLAVGALDQDGVRGNEAMARLQVLVGDSASLVPSPFSPDRSERYQPGSRYPEACARRILEDRAGFTGYAPLILAQDDNIWARDLHARNQMLLARYSARPVYLLVPPNSEVGTPPLFIPLVRDSLAAAWADAGDR